MNYKALVVDDERAEREGIEFLSQRLALPFDMVLAGSSKEALQLLETYPADCLITDIRMPFMNGLVLCREATKLRPGLITVIVSAYDDFGYAKEAIQLKVRDYLLKPVQIEDFRMVMDGVIETLEARRQKADDAARITQGSDALPHTFGKVSWYVSSAICFVQSNYAKDISLEHISEHVHLSPGYFSHLFKKETGMGVSQYINLCRLDRAKHLLTSSNLRISQISQAVGISSASYFCNLFRRHFGQTPQDLRNDAQQTQ